MISREEIENLAALARLSLTDKEVDALRADISSILDYVGQVADSSAQSDMAPALRNAMREDEVRKDGDSLWGKEEALRAAFPRREGDHNVVRKIIQKDE